jgi:protoheme IX farnesyltransferase
MAADTLTINDLSHEKHSLVGDLFSLLKPRLASLVIFTSALGLFMAPVEMEIAKALVAILATSGLVGGACAINCYMERDIDRLMERTKSRPLPSGRISPRTALLFGLSLIFICLSVLYFFINPLTAILGLTAALIYICLYTPLKQKTSLALFAGAIPGAIPPLMGWTAATNSIHILAIILFAILFIWQLPHFLSIAIYHADDYKEASIKTHPGNMGIRPTIHRIAIYTYALFIVSVAPYWVGFAPEAYRNATFIIGGGFFIYSLLGYTFKEGSAELLQWARRYFYGSLIYLPCVFILMIYFRYNS